MSKAEDKARQANKSELNKINLEALQLEELVTVKQRLTQDLQVFLNSYNGLRALEQRFEYSKVLIKQLSEKADENNEVMIPLTTSLFVPGRLKDKKKFLVEIGTGYFAEYDSAGAMAYCDRKSAFTKQTGEKAQAEIDEKRKFIEKINIQIQKKAQERQEAYLKAQQKKGVIKTK